MKFSKYMYEWLYGEDGYYTKYKQIGKKGDFYTSVSTSKFFGGCIAKDIIAQIESKNLPKNATVCEIGAHHGYLLADVIEFIYTLRPELLATLEFAIVERQEELRRFQKKYFSESFGDAVVLRHCENLEELGVENGYFFANEIFDAFECELLYNGKIATVDSTSHKIVFEEVEEQILQKAKKYNKTKGEIALGYEEFAKSMVKAAKHFEFVTFDYGEMEARSDFSLRVYENHKVYPFFEENLQREQLFGKSDITYDVTFAHLRDAFLEAEVTMVEYRTQMSALVHMGLLELLEILQKNVDEKTYKQELEKAKMLISPEFFGERFKMMRLRK